MSALFNSKYTARLAPCPSVDALIPVMVKAIQNDYAAQVEQLFETGENEDFDLLDEYRDEIGEDADGHSLAYAVRREWDRVASRVHPGLSTLVGLTEDRVIHGQAGIEQEDITL